MIFGNKIELLHEMAEKKLVSSQAINIAEFLCGLEKNLSEEEKTALAAVSALLYEWVSSGSICLTKNVIETFIKTNRDDLSGIAFTFPTWEEIKNVLFKSSCCTQDPEHDPKPLVLSNDKIYFYKYWLYEDSLAAKVLDLSQGKGKFAESADAINAVLDKLFEEDAKKYGKRNIEQQEAAETVIKHRFSVITGGPGTGKTTTVAKILAGILSVFPEKKILLAAPTGKAAARMTESLGKETKNIEESNVIDAELLRKIRSVEGQTIHRILGKKFGKPEKNKENPINADLIIADEASMIDIAIFSELLDAVSEETSLILLGDKDQLASVDAGNVFSDICSCRELLPEGTVSELKTSHRFEKHPAIGRLANAVNGQKDAVEVIEICKEEQDLDFATKTLEEIVKTAKENYGFLSDTNPKPEEILKELNSFKVLCPSKEDSLGVEKLNEAIEQALKKNNPSYNSRPVMITRNDYANSGLVNGDCGVILERNGKTEAWFKQNGEISSFNISELPAFETAYAMTIHKSQGSEYKSVLIILPEKDMPILTKELLYTAITRAQTHIEIASGKEVLKNTLDRSAARNSGFKEALEKLKKS